MTNTLLKNARLVNEGYTREADLLIKDGRIDRIDNSISEPAYRCKVIDAAGLYLLPGAIDNHVHFREPGVTHKANMYSESMAAVAGGITSIMEMPNTRPAATSRLAVEEKFAVAARKCIANHSFYIGATNTNIDELLWADRRSICGIKVFMGSSTGNMLVDSEEMLRDIFAQAMMPIATHCEKEEIVLANLEAAKEKYGDKIPFSAHPEIRSVEACYLSTKQAVELAQKYGTRLHILHLTTANELEFFTNEIPVSHKNITTEVCVHFLCFDSDDYEHYGSFIKCNPAIKSAEHKEALWQGLLDGRIDIVCSDHAPHLLEEKNQPYLSAPAGIPLVQHTLPVMLNFATQNYLPIEMVVEKMCHNPAITYQVHDRGFLYEGYHADLVLVDMQKPYTVSPANILYKCGWSPLEGNMITPSIEKTFVNGELIYDNGHFNLVQPGQRLFFDR